MAAKRAASPVKAPAKKAAAKKAAPRAPKVAPATEPVVEEVAVAQHVLDGHAVGPTDPNPVLELPDGEGIQPTMPELHHSVATGRLADRFP